MIFKKFFISILFLTNYSFAWQIIPMQSLKEEQEPARDVTKSFHFPVYAHLDLADRLIVTAQHDNQAKQFSLSYYDFLENVFKPLAIEKVKLNGVADQKNPLFDSAITHIALVDDTLIATIPSAPNKIFAAALPQCKEVLSSSSINDAQGNEIECEIIGLAGGFSRIFAAIKSKNSENGKCENSIVVFGVHSETKDVPLTQEEFDDLKQYLQEEGDEQSIEQISKEITVKDGKRTRKVTEKKLVQLNNSVLESEITDLHWNANLKRLFVALKLKEDHITDSNKNLLVGYCEETGKLLLNPVRFPPFASIEAPKEPSGEVSIRFAPSTRTDFEASYHSIAKIKSMLTTTSLDYLIVLEDNGNVVAMPVLNFHTQEGTIAADKIELQGTLADPSAKPLEGFSNKDYAHVFLGRHFITPAQAYEAKNIQVGGNLDIGPIDHIFVRDDAVYAIVANPYEGSSRGIYYSHAIFDEYGRISAWTKWQPKTLLDEPITNAYVDRLNGSLMAATGKDEYSIQTIKRTQWTNNQLTELIKQEFPQSTGGLHGLIDFPANTPGLNHHMIAFMGFGKLVFTCTEKQLQSFSCNDATLQKLGPLSCSEIAFNESGGYLFAGGVHGLAVLRGDWHKRTFDETFLNAQKAMQFTNIGDYSFVRKIIADEKFLYILTDTVFDRIDMSLSDLNSCRLSITHLAEAQKLQESDFEIFVDAIVSEKCAIIITTTGLYRIGNGNDIRHDSQQTLKWVPLMLYDKAGPAISLIPISTTGRSQDLARDAGQLYVISGSVGNDTARLHRFAVSCVLDKPISDDTIVPLRDFVAENHQSYFANIGNFTSLFATDGTLFFTQGMQRRKKIKTQVLNNNFGRSRRVMPLELSNDAVIRCIARDSASGNWMIGGDFGLIINE